MEKINNFYHQMDRFNIILSIILNKYHYIIKKTIALVLNIYCKKSVIIFSLTLSTSFAFTVILKPEKWNKVIFFLSKQFGN